ncbi:MAG: BrnT family toxin, partial [Moorea sp. SIO2B7]|nr:BrnT family toxin [Moorena sp. SIO2B7]
AESNLRKHGINFAEVTSVLKDNNAITIYDEHPIEDRYITIGMSDLGKLLVVVYTLRHNKIRLLSARKTNKGESQQYFN